ncbi:uncharacterized protein LOC135828348 isoform X2 [Sycon ciliatum]|uniref:uncharacterized protein LOC135828348 isoform X2 n=1 Tax=Sycon ciliatum TaxID=27933 RepID=UPI0031F63665
MAADQWLQNACSETLLPGSAWHEQLEPVIGAHIAAQLAPRLREEPGLASVLCRRLGHRFVSQYCASQWSTHLEQSEWPAKCSTNRRTYLEDRAEELLLACVNTIQNGMRMGRDNTSAGPRSSPISGSRTQSTSGEQSNSSCPASTASSTMEGRPVRSDVLHDMAACTIQHCKDTTLAWIDHEMARVESERANPTPSEPRFRVDDDPGIKSTQAESTHAQTSLATQHCRPPQRSESDVAGGGIVACTAASPWLLPRMRLRLHGSWLSDSMRWLLWQQVVLYEAAEAMPSFVNATAGPVSVFGGHTEHGNERAEAGRSSQHTPSPTSSSDGPTRRIPTHGRARAERASYEGHDRRRTVPSRDVLRGASSAMQALLCEGRRSLALGVDETRSPQNSIFRDAVDKVFATVPALSTYAQRCGEQHDASSSHGGKDVRRDDGERAPHSSALDALLSSTTAVLDLLCIAEAGERCHGKHGVSRAAGAESVWQRPHQHGKMMTAVLPVSVLVSVISTCTFPTAEDRLPILDNATLFYLLQYTILPSRAKLRVAAQRASVMLERQDPALHRKLSSLVQLSMPTMFGLSHVTKFQGTPQTGESNTESITQDVSDLLEYFLAEVLSSAWEVIDLPSLCVRYQQYSSGY